MVWQNVFMVEMRFRLSQQSQQRVTLNLGQGYFVFLLCHRKRVDLADRGHERKYNRARDCGRVSEDEFGSIYLTQIRLLYRESRSTVGASAEFIPPYSVGNGLAFGFPPRWPVHLYLDLHAEF